MYQAAGAAAQVLGQVLQAVAANKARHKMEEAYKQEMKRQRGFRNEAFGVVEGAFPQMGVETAREQMGAGQAHRESLYEQVGQIPFSPNQPVGMGPTESDKANIGMAGQARAKLGSYTDWQLDQMINNIRTQNELNRIVNFSGGEAQVFPWRMYDAQHSADALDFAGNALSSLGGAVSGFGGLSLPTKKTSFGSAGGSMYDLPRDFQNQYEVYV